eukprot:TRINITY_DN27418_c0_g1_i2.p1 TRINITY_DN27418_c0_g1~~TRINITY_DN27418_c0_g1_i2.p1  ORF type:complete len:161 (-),score=47.81 TRINITY_DN27418_c0_g1_i2:83-565(-)
MGFFFFQAEDGIRDVERSRGLGDVYKRQYKCSVRGYLFANFHRKTIFQSIIERTSKDIPTKLMLKIKPLMQEDIQESISKFEAFKEKQKARGTMRLKNFCPQLPSNFTAKLLHKNLHSHKLELDTLNSVSYTHLTLPTILLVQISVVAVSLKKKTKKKEE